MQTNNTPETSGWVIPLPTGDGHNHPEIGRPFKIENKISETFCFLNDHGVKVYWHEDNCLPCPEPLPTIPFTFKNRFGDFVHIPECDGFNLRPFAHPGYEIIDESRYIFWEFGKGKEYKKH